MNSSANRRRSVPDLVPFTVTVAFLVLFPCVPFAQQPALMEQNDTIPKSPTTTATSKANVRQVLLDVVVADRNDHSVNELHQDDFTVYQDNIPQKIRSDFHLV
jgi:hypothetical protein